MAAAIPAVGATLLEAALAGLSRLAMSSTGKWLGAALISMGFEFGTIAVFSTPFLDKVKSSMAGIPGQFADWAGVLNVDIYVSMVVGAIVMKQLKEAGRMHLLKAGRR